MFLGPYLARTLNETNNLTYVFISQIIFLLLKPLYCHIQIVLLV